MGIVLRRRGFCMVVGILVMLFSSGRCQMFIAAPCNGTIGGCHAEDEFFVDVDTAEINIYEAVEFAMDSEISRRILAVAKPSVGASGNPKKPAVPVKHGKPYTRPCTYGNKCERGTPPKPPAHALPP